MKKLLLSALICVLLTGCVSMRPFPSSLSAQDKIASYLENLCSEEFAGRLPGTPGNDLAAEWLSDRLDEWDIEPYAGGSYFVGYPGRVNEFIRSEITLTDASGVSRELVRGEDFIIGQAMGNFETVIEADSENYELVKDGGRLNLNARSGVSGTYVVFNEREFSGGSNSYVPNQPARSTVLVSVSEEFGDIIGSGDFERIEIVNEITGDIKELYNVVGMIKGTDPDNCVVISAHFDHSGEAGAIYFPGALDNASGTGALLYIAERLKAASETEPLDFDVVIAFFNSEEAYFSPDDEAVIGSAAFAEDIMDDYKNIYNINIDMVGQEGEVYAIGGSRSAALSADFTEFAAEHGIVCDSGISKPGDNLNFTDRSIPSLYIATDETPDYYHRAGDTPDKVSTALVVKISDVIVDFLKAPGHGVYAYDGSSDSGSAFSPLEGYTPPPAPPAEMAAQYKDVFDTLLGGGDVGFYEGFYKDYPEEEQYIFSYGEYLDKNANIEPLRCLGDYELKIIREYGESQLGMLVYVNPFNTLMPHLIIRTGISGWSSDVYELAEIPELEGFSRIILTEYNTDLGFVYSDEGLSFEITPSRIMYDVNMPIAAFATSSLLSVDAGIEILKSIDFAQFLEGWKALED